jgi:hypothetical protein
MIDLINLWITDRIIWSGFRMKLLFRISFTYLRKLFVLCLWINLCLRLLTFNSSYLLVYLAYSTKSNYHTFEIRIVSLSLAISFDAHIIVFVSCVHVYSSHFDYFPFFNLNIFSVRLWPFDFTFVKVISVWSNSGKSLSRRISCSNNWS